MAAFLVGLALVNFFSASNALFLDEIGAEELAWVYIANAPLVIVAGLGYAAWTRRASTATVLNGSIVFLVLSVTVLWIWTATTSGPAAPFMLAVWFRFLFIFGFLGLWEVASAVFDVRQAKRLFPAVALGAMLAFMLGGAAVPVLASLIGTTHLLAVSAICFAGYAVAFRRAVGEAAFDEADATDPATPRQIISHRFSRNLAAMRSITILLIFVTEFIFYGQVEANLGGEESIARFLGIFLAGSTLAMVIVTATMSATYISRFGLGVGLATMPAGLLLSAVALLLWGVFVGVDRGFFVIAIAANVINMVLANAIETPVGAVMYQPMPPDRRMPVRVAVDGWLGSVAVLVAGLLLLGFEAADIDGELPFVWLLAAIGVAGVVLARRLYGDYRQALSEATTLAFHGSSGGELLLGELGEGQTLMNAGLVGDDPAAIYALTALAVEVGDSSIDLLIPELLTSDDDEVALVAVAAAGASPDPTMATNLRALVDDGDRSPRIRAEALRALDRVDPSSADAAVEMLPSAALRPSSGADLFAVQALAVRVPSDPSAFAIVEQFATSSSAGDRRLGAAVLAACPPGRALDSDARALIGRLLDDDDAAVASQVIDAAAGRLDSDLAERLIRSGAQLEQRRPCVAALASDGGVAIESIETVIDDLPESYVVDLVDDVYAVSTRRPPLLHRFLAPTMPSPIRRAGFDAVRRADIDLPATVQRMVRDDVEWIHKLVAARLGIDNGTSTGTGVPAELLRHMLADEFEAARRTIWAALRTRGNTDRVEELETLVANTTGEDRANAVEALDAVLDRATRELIVPVLEPADLDEAAELLDVVDAANDNADPLTNLRGNPRLSAPSRRLLDHHLAPDLDATEAPMTEILERVLACKRIDIFSTLSYELLVELAEIARDQHAAAGDVIIEEGALGDELFALVEGEVAIGDSDIRLATGTVFGELAVLSPGPRTATVTAQTDCEMLVVERDTLLALAERRPTVMAEIARVLAERLQESGPRSPR